MGTKNIFELIYDRLGILEDKVNQVLENTSDLNGEPEQILSMKEAEEYLGMRSSNILSLIANNHLRAQMAGVFYIFRKSDLNEFIKSTSSLSRTEKTALYRRDRKVKNISDNFQ